MTRNRKLREIRLEAKHLGFPDYLYRNHIERDIAMHEFVRLAAKDPRYAEAERWGWNYPQQPKGFKRPADTRITSPLFRGRPKLDDRGQVKPKTKIPGWMRRNAHRVNEDHLAEEAWNRHREFRAARSSEETRHTSGPKGPETPPQSQPLATPKVQAQEAAVGDLKARDRELLRLAGSKSQKELAELFALSQSQVSRIIKKGKPSTGKLVRFPSSAS